MALSRCALETLMLYVYLSFQCHALVFILSSCTFHVVEIHNQCCYSTKCFCSPPFPLRLTLSPQPSSLLLCNFSIFLRPSPVYHVTDLLLFRQCPALRTSACAHAACPPSARLVSDGQAIYLPLPRADASRAQCMIPTMAQAWIGLRRYVRPAGCSLTLLKGE
ncbi:hypothetical protein B0H10DRAFT_1690 [Mycena sp. CBHHK59/15]|nr:hypothetical protein B0H10DRAFT_1690 [Mycena sp. CBHHK59/15]